MSGGVRGSHGGGQRMGVCVRVGGIKGEGEGGFQEVRVPTGVSTPLGE